MNPTRPLLDGKRLLVTGVVTTDSIAFATAAAALDHGAELVLTALGRDLERAQAAADELPGGHQVLETDLTDATHLAWLRDQLRQRVGHLDGAVHAVAFAPRGALAGRMTDVDPVDVERAITASTTSYASLAGVLADLAPATGGSLVGLDFDATKAWPVYNWMGVAKAGLESLNRYLARDLGPQRIRTNLVAAGPIRTRAAGGIPDFDVLTDAWDTTAPLPWDAKDAAPVADATCFLLSDLARMVTGEILHVDAGHHAMAAPIRPGA